jgi:hypothetical protein
MTLPITNQNVYKWRDEDRAIDSADVSGNLLTHEKVRQTSFFVDRYDKPKELSQ